MKITFNQLGIITETDYTDESLRQGNIGNHLIAKFENESNVDCVATFNFTRSDGTRIKDILMVAGDESDEFKYTFNNLWFFAKYGITTITIFLRENGVIVAQGQIQFNIEQTDFDENVEITYDQYQALIDSIAELSTYSLGSISDVEILNELQDGVNTFIWNGEDSSPFTNGTSYFIFTNREESQTIISANGDLFTIATREYISENEYGDWNITSFGANSFYTKAESDARYYTKADTYSKVESDLRYYTKSEIIASYATKSYVDDEVRNAREVAEGKCQTHNISFDEVAPADETEFGEDTYYYPDGTQIETWQDYQTFTNGLYCSNDDFNDQDDALNITASYIITDEHKVIPLNSTYLHKGDIILVIQTNVPDRWYDGRYTMYRLETAKVDLSDYARLSRGNTFNGNNVFNGTSFFDNSVDFEQDVSFAGEITSNFVPKINNTYDLGFDNGTPYYWRDLHLSRYLTDGTNSITIADIVNGTFNVINATDIVNNTLTQAQYDLITNGKPTLIKGVLDGTSNPMIFNGNTYDNTYYRALFIGKESNGNSTKLRNIQISIVSKQITYSSYTMYVESNGKISSFVNQLNNKTFPAYPSNTGTFGFKSVDGTLSWQQEWYGTQAEYDALGTYDSNTIYNIIEE